jgi:chromosome partitioning protein
MAKIISIVNQKGGVGKTTSAVNLVAALGAMGKKVLLIDCDAQGSLTESLGFQNPDEMEITLSTLMGKAMNEEPIKSDEGILHHDEGVDLVPANIELSGMETALVNIMSRERVLKNYIDSVKDNYDYVLIDCTPSLGMLTINSLVAADEVIIPVQAHYLPLKGLEQLVTTVTKVQKQINPNLKFSGILLTMVDRRTLYNKEVSSVIRLNYSKYLKIFKTEIPASIRAAEASSVGKSIFEYDKKGIAAEAYKNFTKEVLNDGRVRNKHRSERSR